MRLVWKGPGRERPKPPVQGLRYPVYEHSGLNALVPSLCWSLLFSSAPLVCPEVSQLKDMLTFVSAVLHCLDFDLLVTVP